MLPGQVHGEASPQHNDAVLCDVEVLRQVIRDELRKCLQEQLRDGVICKSKSLKDSARMLSGSCAALDGGETQTLMAEAVSDASPVVADKVHVGLMPVIPNIVAEPFGFAVRDVDHSKAEGVSTVAEGISQNGEDSSKCSRGELNSKGMRFGELAPQDARSDKGMALIAGKGFNNEIHLESRWQRLAARIICSLHFEIFMLALIFANAAQVGIQTDYLATQLSKEAPPFYRHCDVAFCIIFAVELSVRVYVYRFKFFSMYGWAWNIFDTILVMVQVFEECLLLVVSSADDEVGLFPGFLLRIVRILRSIRVMRVLMVMRYTEDLQLLVSCILHSVRTFFWASALLFLMTFVAAIYLTQIVLDHRLDHRNAQSSAILKNWYGTVPLSCLSLFQALTGGVDWNDIVRPLIDHISPWLGVAAVIWVAFAILAVMNIVTATFVENACSRSSEVKDICMINQAKMFFRVLDKDKSGRIEVEELAAHLEDDLVREHFEQLNVDVSKAMVLFDLLDTDSSGSVDFDEFLGGCLRIQGPARAWDIMVIARETRGLLQQQAQRLTTLGTSLQELRDLIAQSVLC